jgi:hypothetical protein
MQDFFEIHHHISNQITFFWSDHFWPHSSKRGFELNQNLWRYPLNNEPTHHKVSSWLKNYLDPHYGAFLPNSSEFEQKHANLASPSNNTVTFWSVVNRIWSGVSGAVRKLLRSHNSGDWTESHLYILQLDNNYLVWDVWFEKFRTTLYSCGKFHFRRVQSIWLFIVVVEFVLQNLAHDMLIRDITPFETVKVLSSKIVKPVLSKNSNLYPFPSASFVKHPKFQANNQTKFF